MDNELIIDTSEDLSVFVPHISKISKFDSAFNLIQKRLFN